MKKLTYLIFILTLFSSYSQQDVIPNYELAAKFSPKKIAKLVHSTSVNPRWLKNGDKFWLLAHKFFGNRKHWYVIAQLNNKPTESHVKIGESIKIPYNIHEALQEMKK